MTRKITLIGAFALLFAFVGFAQDDAMIQDEVTKDAEKNAQWRTGEYAYSSKPKSAWEVGLGLGHFMINGDVKTNPFKGFGVSLHARKALGYVFSLRGEVMYGRHTSFDDRIMPISAIQAERFYIMNEDNAQAAVNAYGAANQPFFRNYQTSVIGGSIQAIANIGNILFHKENNKWGAHALAGVGIYSSTVKLNLLDGNGSIYNYNSVLNGRDIENKDDRKDIVKDIRDLLDGNDFNTEVSSGNRNTLFGSDSDLHASFHLGLGVSRKLSKRVNLSLEHQAIFSHNDMLDGYRQRTAVDRSNNDDVMHYTSIRLNVNLGKFDKRTEPLYWMNPVAPAMNDIAELKRRPILDLTDTDGDGVIDMLDAEPETQPGAPVDTRGVALDSDGDGVIDALDKEKFSVSGYPVDEHGVAQIPEGPKYTTEDDVVKIFNNKMGDIDVTPRWFLPMIHFDLDKYYVKPEFYPELHQVALVMKQNPNLRLVVKGYTDVRMPNDYNRVLSYNRANAAIDHLVSQHGIDRSRLVLQYGGKDDPIVPGLPENHSISKEKEVQQYLNRRVEFHVAKAGDQSMGRPAGPEAGEGTPGSSRSGTKYSGNRNSGY